MKAVKELQKVNEKLLAVQNETVKELVELGVSKSLAELLVSNMAIRVLSELAGEPNGKV